MDPRGSQQGLPRPLTHLPKALLTHCNFPETWKKSAVPIFLTLTFHLSHVWFTDLSLLVIGRLFKECANNMIIAFLIGESGEQMHGC